MRNRTNRTPSANTNRLNLGTRSLVLNTNECNGYQTLRVCHAHGFAMRGGVFLSSDPAITASAIGIPSIPGSSPVDPWPSVGPVVWPPVVDPATAHDAHADRPVAGPVQRGNSQGQPRALSQQGSVKRGHKSLRDLTLREGKAKGRGCERATLATAAASVAAAGG
jgi:hypothetical protein